MIRRGGCFFRMAVHGMLKSLKKTIIHTILVNTNTMQILINYLDFICSLMKQGYLMTVGENQQGKRAIALAPCFFAPTILTMGYQVSLFHFNNVLDALFDQSEASSSVLVEKLEQVSMLKILSVKKTWYLFDQ